MKLKTKRKPKKSKNKIYINLDLDKGLFYGKKLTIEEKSYLGNNGYKVDNLVPIGKTHYEEVWVKVNKVESIEHTFLVYNIQEVISPQVKTTKINIVREVDLLVLDKHDNEIAIEVETGKGFKKHKKRIFEKFKLIKNKHEVCIIVLTNSDYKTHYQRLLKDLEIEIITRNEILKLIQNKKK